jgi:solute carrier family 7 (cationic amino acid transporter), member 3
MNKLFIKKTVNNGSLALLKKQLPLCFQDPDAPFPYVFEQIGWPAIKWIVTVGAIFALCTW